MTTVEYKVKKISTQILIFSIESKISALENRRTSRQRSNSLTSDHTLKQLTPPLKRQKLNKMKPLNEPERKDFPFKKEEAVRLILQMLNDFGYYESSQTLEKESGFLYETNTITQFRDNILNGDWEAVESLLDSMNIDSKTKLESAKFLIKKQKFLELLEQKQLKKALQVLRSEITPLNCDPEELHNLSSLIVYGSVEDLKEKANWPGSNGSARMSLYSKLQTFIPSSLIIPDRRLEYLLKQACNLQELNCLYHNSNTQDYSLFSDHVCEKDQFPCVTTHILEEHRDEVWYISFSPDGKRLASGSKDFTAIIWDVDTWMPIHSLVGHEDAVSFVSWSPNGKMLITCSNDHKLKLWDSETGVCLRTFSRHINPVTSCAWMPDNERFVSGSLDKSIYLWNIDGNLLYRWLGARVTDLALYQDGSKMVAVDHENKIRIYDIQEKSEVCIKEDDSITSLCLSSDSRYALVNISAQEVHLWDLEDKKLVHKYTGQKQGRFVIRSCFGGLNQSFIVSGSEDFSVYIWQKDHATLLEVLVGHTGTVNSVAWNPKLPHMFASASDDNTIRIWGRRTGAAATTVATSSKSVN